MNIFLLQAAQRQQMQVAAFVRMRKGKWGMLSYGKTPPDRQGFERCLESRCCCRSDEERRDNTEEQKL